MALVIEDQYSPLCLVEIWRKGLRVGHVMQDLMTVSTQKALNKPDGQFSLTMRGGSKTWQNLDGDEWVIVRGARYRPARGAVSNAPTWPVLMSGQITTITEPVNISSGRPEWVATISGTDAGGWLLEAMIDYHYEQLPDNPSSAAIGGFNPALGLETKYGLAATETSAADFFIDVTSTALQKALLTGKRAWNPKIPLLATDTLVPDKYRGNGMVAQTFSGSIWNLLDYVNARPFTEIFIAEGSGIDPQPVVVYRLSPITDATGKVGFATQEPASQMHYRQVDVLGTSLARSTAEAFSWYFVYPTYSSYAKLAFPVEIATGGNPALDEAIHNRLGFKPLDIECPIVSMTTGVDATTLQENKLQAQVDCVELAGWCKRVFGDNLHLRSGTITLPLTPHISVGSYAINSDTKREAYVEGVAHQIDIASGSATTSLTVTRERAIPKGS